MIFVILRGHKSQAVVFHRISFSIHEYPNTFAVMALFMTQWPELSSSLYALTKFNQNSWKSPNIRFDDLKSKPDFTKDFLIFYNNCCLSDCYVSFDKVCNIFYSIFLSIFIVADFFCGVLNRHLTEVFELITQLGSYKSSIINCHHISFLKIIDSCGSKLYSWCQLVCA